MKKRLLNKIIFATCIYIGVDFFDINAVTELINYKLKNLKQKL